MIVFGPLREKTGELALTLSVPFSALFDGFLSSFWSVFGFDSVWYFLIGLNSFWSRSVDEDMGEFVELIDRDRSPDDVRYTLAQRPTAASRHRSEAGIGSPARDGKKYRTTTEVRMEVENRTPARARDAPEYVTGESPDTRRAKCERKVVTHGAR